MKKKFTYLLLTVVVLLSVVVRFYKLDQYPPSITWDEASVGYNAYSIIHWGKDEWGKTLPLTFKSFGDDKNPVHIYLTSLFVGVFGLDDFTTRTPAALFGVLNVIAIFFLAKKIFKSDAVGLISSLFLAVSSYNIQFSRFNHELNFAIFFFIFGVFLFLEGTESKKKLLIPSFLFLGIDLLTYQSAKVVTPALVLLLILLNLKKLLSVRKYFATGLIIYLFFVGLHVVKPELLGGARLGQNEIRMEEIEKSAIFKRGGSLFLGKIQVVFNRYLMYYQPRYLFVSGDANPRHSIQRMGTFYWFDLPLLLIGLVGILGRLVLKKDLKMLLLLAWILLAPIPGAVSSALPHSSRAMFLTGSWSVICAYGAYLIINLFKNKYYKTVMSILLIVGIAPFFWKYLKIYFGEYTQKYAIEWIYGMEDIVGFTQKVKLNRVYMTEAFMQPYIFFLYYQKTPLPEFLSTVKYNETDSRPSNLVKSFSINRFGWDQIFSEPADGVLYVVTPSIYDGLSRKTDFDVAKLVKYPDGANAFYMLLPK